MHSTFASAKIAAVFPRETIHWFPSHGLTLKSPQKKLGFFYLASKCIFRLEKTYGSLNKNVIILAFEWRNMKWVIALLRFLFFQPELGPLPSSAYHVSGAAATAAAGSTVPHPLLGSVHGLTHHTSLVGHHPHHGHHHQLSTASLGGYHPGMSSMSSDVLSSGPNSLSSDIYESIYDTRWKLMNQVGQKERQQARAIDYNCAT